MNGKPFIIIPLDVLRRPDLLPLAKLVYGRLRLYAGTDGVAYPKRATLAAELATTPRHVRRMLEKLQAAGLVEAVALPGKPNAVRITCAEGGPTGPGGRTSASGQADPQVRPI